MIYLKFRVVLSTLLCIIASLYLTACSGPSDPGSLHAIKNRAQLVVITRNAPTTWYEGRERIEGFEHDLMSAYAQHLDVDIEFKIANSVGEALEMLDKGMGDLVAAGVTITDERSNRFLFSRSYQSVTQKLICHRNTIPAKTIIDLTGLDLVVAAKSSYEEQLRKLKRNTSELSWLAIPDVGSEQLIAEVANEKYDCTIADSNIANINRRYYPELRVGLSLSKPQTLASVLPQAADELKESLNSWLKAYKKASKLAKLIDRYYGHATVFDFVEMRSYQRRIADRLPEFQDLFEQAAKTEEIPWTLLAALSYQESHWNPKAKSPTWGYAGS